MVERKDSKDWLRMAGLGMELTGAVVGGVAIGWWIDRQLGSSPKATLGGGLIGIVGGLYNLLKAALRSGRR